VQRQRRDVVEVDATEVFERADVFLDACPDVQKRRMAFKVVRAAVNRSTSGSKSGSTKYLINSWLRS